MNKQFIAIIVVVVLGLFGVLMLTKKSDQTATNNQTSQSQGSNHTIGAGKKKVTLVEFGDFQCPACKSYAPIVKQLKANYGDDITFQFRHFPLTQIHPNATITARAAEAAGKQGKFFEMHDLLYENQDSWARLDNPSSVLEGFASQLGLNMDQFKKDLADANTLAIINADQKAGQAVGVNSTPTFVINGKKVESNPKSLDEFKQLIDEAIAQSNRS
jgi:protein-disulfide isomerase